jgi:hypothetical protein
MDTETISKWAKLNQEKKELEKKIDGIKEEMSVLESAIIDEMANDGITQIKLTNGLGAVYLHKQIWPKMETDDRDVVVQAVKMVYPEIVKENYNTNTLAAIMREMDANGESLPGAWEGIITASEKFSLRNRRG